MLLVSGIALPFYEDEDEAISIAIKRAGVKRSEISDSYVYKRSLDARRRDNIKFVYTVALSGAYNERSHLDRRDNGIKIYKEKKLAPPHGEEELAGRPVVVGFGPAGMFAAWLLAKNGYRPIVIERGGSIEERVSKVGGFFSGGDLDCECNVQFGEGGAGTFSDGKLNTRIGDELCELVLKTLHRLGAPGEIVRSQKPHIGTDRLREVVVKLRCEIISLGGEVLFNTKLTGIKTALGAVTAAETSAGDIKTGVIILAPGHSARDSFLWLYNSGVAMEPKSFSVGVRIEHLKSDIDRGLYGKFAGHPRLPAGEYQLSLRQGSRAGYTFCMCPGGVVVPAASGEGQVVTNGMSEFSRDGKNSNSALCCSVSPSDFGEGVLDGMKFQESLEAAAFLQGGKGYLAPCQTVGRFLQGRGGADLGRVTPSYERGVTEGDFNRLFPGYITEMLGRSIKAFGVRLPGFSEGDAVLTGVETRTSSPIRILRGEDMQASLKGLYPAGEGAGYAGGIMSAAVDGLKVAMSVIGRFSEI